MPLHPLAGQPAPASMLIDVRQLEDAYYTKQPNLDDPTQLVAFGTSGHRGTSLAGSFTEAHILAITQAICDYRRAQGITGPLYVGQDTHALSAAAQRTALEVLAANGAETFIQSNDGFTPTPVISRAILAYNRGRTAGSGRWRGHHAFAQPAHRRRLQIQSARRRPRRYRDYQMDSRSRERFAAAKQSGCETHAV